MFGRKKCIQIKRSNGIRYSLFVVIVDLVADLTVKVGLDGEKNATNTLMATYEKLHL